MRRSTGATRASPFLISPALGSWLRWGTLLAVMVNAASMLTPIINEGDSVLYAALSQHIAATNDWGDLVLDGMDWLDKPHFPFWIGALFFKLGGISAFTYILPGFLFHLLGGYYTYRIARLFYGRDVGLLALLLYVSTYHLMYTSSAIKAEAFLTGSMTAACYYWLRYDRAGRLKYLLLGALFSAISVMTKGIFTLITISSGLACLWLYQGEWRKLFSGKWFLAVVLSVLMTAPEVLALYWQFDTHPEKVVFGQTHVSGIKFFLWDSQFGRFFNSGPIKNQQGTPLYFVHVFLWAYLPWVAVFGAALVSGLRRFGAGDHNEKSAFVFLCGTFFITFGLFSATSFQLDYYTVILFPFANILSARYLADYLQGSGSRLFQFSHGLVTLLTLGLALALAAYLGNQLLLGLVLAGVLALLVFAVWQRRQFRLLAAVFYPVVAVSLLYLFLEGMTLTAYLNYSIPYNVNQLLKAQPALPVVVYQLDPIVAWELALYRTGAPSTGASEATQLPAPGRPYFLVVKTATLPELAGRLGPVQEIAKAQWVDHKTGTLPRQLQLAKGAEPMDSISVVKVGL